MAIRRTRKNTIASANIDPVVRLWLLRILVPLGTYRGFIQQDGFTDDALAEAVGLGHWVEPSTKDFDPKRVTAELRQLHSSAEKTYSNAKHSRCLRNNMGQISKLVGLTETECRILEFAIMMGNECILEDAAERLGQLSSNKTFHVLSVILHVPEEDIRTALNTRGTLAQSGMVSMCRNGTSSLGRKLDLLSGEFADLMTSIETEPVNLLRGTISAAVRAQLKLSDYHHIQASLDILVPYIRHASTTGRRGVNIFLHGSPGTGKSELARVLAEEIGCELFEVSSEDSDGDPVDGEDRLRAFRATQCFFAQRAALIAFDEVEDVFNDGDGFFGKKSTAQVRKAWINRMLEDNPVPTIWLSNSIYGVDPAFVRRFDMVIELPIPPKTKRLSIVRESCHDLIGEKCMARISEIETLAPAVISRSASVMRAIKGQLSENERTLAFEHMINNTLRAQGHTGIRKQYTNELSDLYDPEFIHADADLAQIAKRLTQARTARICLYGPPGTGKTAYCRWLAQQLGTPLIVKRASDLLSPYVGENERNIALTFKQAESERAVLLIDEIDSFLQDRRGAGRNWEVTLVNEMLTQMESFSGIFVASTNLMHGLDQAALRRFDLKVKFNYLTFEQSLVLLERYCQQLNLNDLDAYDRSQMSTLFQLTPGDFATIARQHQFRPIASANELIKLLRAECELKEKAPRRIGFIQ